MESKGRNQSILGSRGEPKPSAFPGNSILPAQGKVLNKTLKLLRSYHNMLPGGMAVCMCRNFQKARLETVGALFAEAVIQSPSSNRSLQSLSTLQHFFHPLRHSIYSCIYHSFSLAKWSPFLTTYSEGTGTTASGAHFNPRRYCVASV